MSLLFLDVADSIHREIVANWHVGSNSDTYCSPAVAYTSPSPTQNTVEVKATGESGDGESDMACVQFSTFARFLCQLPTRSRVTVSGQFLPLGTMQILARKKSWWLDHPGSARCKLYGKMGVSCLKQDGSLRFGHNPAWQVLSSVVRTAEGDANESSTRIVAPEVLDWAHHWTSSDDVRPTDTLAVRVEFLLEARTNAGGWFRADFNGNHCGLNAPFVTVGY